MRASSLAAACFVLAAGPAAPAALAAQDDVRIRLARETRAEGVMASELRALLADVDTRPWTLTREVVIDERAIPHSHPVLTIHTRHVGDRSMLLSTWLHEQLHWLEEARPEAWAAAMADLRALYPEVPSSAEGGARDEESTWRHLLVCDLELQAMTALVGEEEARRTLGRITHYEWIYDEVLHDPRVREVSLRHGFDVAEGAALTTPTGRRPRP